MDCTRKSSWLHRFYVNKGSVIFPVYNAARWYFWASTESPEETWSSAHLPVQSVYRAMLLEAILMSPSSPLCHWPTEVRARGGERIIRLSATLPTEPRLDSRSDSAEPMLSLCPSIGLPLSLAHCPLCALQPRICHWVFLFLWDFVGPESAKSRTGSLHCLCIWLIMWIIEGCSGERSLSELQILIWWFNFPNRKVVEESVIQTFSLEGRSHLPGSGKSVGFSCYNWILQCVYSSYLQFACTDFFFPVHAIIKTWRGILCQLKMAAVVCYRLNKG